MAKAKPTTPKVFIASPICDAKAYTQSVLSQVSFDVKAFKDTAPLDMAIVPRIAKVREEIRQAFLKSDCTHLYFHDADMIPPSDIIDRLLAHDRDIASGLYLIRTYTEPLAPVMLTLEQGRTGIYLGQTGIFTEGDTQEVLGVGMGCMLIRRSVLESVGFRKTDEYTIDSLAEDYQFCLDAQEAGFQKPLIDLTLPCWHVDGDGWANSPVVGGQVYSASYIGSGGSVSNVYGRWEKGVPRAISQSSAANLNYDFWHGYAREITVRKEKKI